MFDNEKDPARRAGEKNNPAPILSEQIFPSWISKGPCLIAMFITYKILNSLGLFHVLKVYN